MGSHNKRLVCLNLLSHRLKLFSYKFFIDVVEVEKEDADLNKCPIYDAYD
jgi:hypothetical protein